MLAKGFNIMVLILPATVTRLWVRQKPTDEQNFHIRIMAINLGGVLEKIALGHHG